MMRRRSFWEYNVWPVVADCIIAVTALLVIMFAGRKALDPGLEKFKETLKSKLKVDQQAGKIYRFEVTDYEARIVYSADWLSFTACDWDIPQDRIEKIQEHISWFSEGSSFVERIQIEGHADRRGIDRCRGLIPYRDNLQLSQYRARAVYNCLIGIPPRQVAGLDDILHGIVEVPPPRGLEFVRELNKRGKLLIAGYGDTVPIDRENPEHPLNRRVEVIAVFLERTVSVSVAGGGL